MSQTGKQLKKKYPKWVAKHKIEDEDIIYLVGDKIKILKSYANKRNKKII
jgi:hypothetical protein